MEARIKAGETVWHDHRLSRWPDLRNVADENMIFSVVNLGAVYELTARGFGSREDYGTGPILVDRLWSLKIV